MNTHNYLRIKDVPKKYPAFSESSIRWLIFNKRQNGFSSVIRKIGSRILIDEAEFVQWIENSKITA